MDDAAFYRSVRRILKDFVPLRFDCGRLCGSACCKPGPELPGMYLFPGEEALYAGLAGFTVSSALLPGYGPAALLSCDGSCHRDERPLACRFFPLAPKVEGDRVYARPDPRGRAICPLCRQGAGALSGGFTIAVERAFSELIAHPGAGRFFEALSCHLDVFEHQLTL